MPRGCSVLILLAGVLHPAIGQPQEGVEPDLPDLSRVPAPLLEEFEPTVRSQLATSRDAVAAAVGDGRVVAASTAFATLCLVYLRYELMSAAEPCLEQLRILEPQDHRWPYYQSILYDRDGLFDRALASAEAALGLRRDDLPTWIRTARLRSRTGDLAAAEAGYREVLARDPASSAALYGRGRHRGLALPPNLAAAMAAFGRQALHAAELGFRHPVTEEWMSFASPLPPDFAALVELISSAAAVG